MINQKQKIRVCETCFCEVKGIGDSDEHVDFCEQCDVVVEGNTLDVTEEQLSKLLEEQA